MNIVGFGEVWASNLMENLKVGKWGGVEWGGVGSSDSTEKIHAAIETSHPPENPFTLTVPTIAPP